MTSADRRFRACLDILEAAAETNNGKLDRRVIEEFPPPREEGDKEIDPYNESETECVVAIPPRTCSMAVRKSANVA